MVGEGDGHGCVRDSDASVPMTGQCVFDDGTNQLSPMLSPRYRHTRLGEC